MLKLAIGLGLITLIVNTRPLTTEQLIKHYARKHKVQLSLAKALVKVESGFNPKAISNKQALGLTQVVYRWHHERCNLTSEAQLFDPATNLDCGLSYLRELYTASGSITEALAKYNGGNQGHRKQVCIAYAHRVLKHSKEYL